MAMPMRSSLLSDISFDFFSRVYHRNHDNHDEYVIIGTARRQTVSVCGMDVDEKQDTATFNIEMVE